MAPHPHHDTDTPDTTDPATPAPADGDRPGTGAPRHLTELTRAECLDLLGRATVGRVGLTVDALPVILPVNFVLLGQDPVIRTGWGPKLRAAADGQVVCFEADGIDPAAGTGWSVLVTGRSCLIRRPEVPARVTTLPLEPWAPMDSDLYVLIRSELVSGRRAGPRRDIPGRAPS